MELELSPKDRVFLANQLRILEALYPDEADSYSRWRAAVEGGFTLHYAEGAPWLDSETSLDECREVLDILDMFRTLEASYQQLSDKSGLSSATIAFQGFDGNNEGEQLGYADYFINTLGRFSDLKDCGDGLNSHMPVLDSYRRMLAAWGSRKRNLSRDEIAVILAARTHPSNL